MNRWWLFAVVLALSFVSLAVSPADEKEKTRNPFKVMDVTDPDGEDVKEFAAKVKLAGGAKDANAEQWATKVTAGKAGSLDGEWAGRWNGGSAGTEWVSGTAKVKSVGDRVYILYEEDATKYLIEAKRDGKTRLVGRYLNLGSPTDSSPWVGIIENDERIDGEWNMGRWDFRRKPTAK